MTGDKVQRSKPTEEKNGEDIVDKIPGDASTVGVFSVNNDWDEPLKEGETEINLIINNNHDPKLL